MTTMHTRIHELRESELAEQLEPLLDLDDRTFVHSWGREGVPERLNPWENTPPASVEARILMRALRRGLGLPVG